MKNCVYFGTDLNASPLYVEDEFFESKRLQALPSERVSASFNMMVRSMLESHYELDKEAMQVHQVNFIMLKLDLSLKTELVVKLIDVTKLLLNFKIYFVVV